MMHNLLVPNYVNVSLVLIVDAEHCADGDDNDTSGGDGKS